MKKKDFSKEQPIGTAQPLKPADTLQPVKPVAETMGSGGVQMDDWYKDNPYNYGGQKAPVISPSTLMKYGAMDRVRPMQQDAQGNYVYAPGYAAVSTPYDGYGGAEGWQRYVDTYGYDGVNGGYQPVYEKDFTVGAGNRYGDRSGAEANFMGQEAYDRVQQLRQDYADAMARGDTEAAAAAHAAAEAIRYQYGWSGGADGSEYLPLEAYVGDQDYYQEWLNGQGKWHAPSYQAPDFVSRYQAQIDALTAAILGREAFSYDKDSDPLYAQYKDTYTREGKRSMQDTLGQVSARSGGLASSYAQSAAQQSYNNYMARLADKVPELQQLAYSMYMDELGQKRNDLSMLMGLDDVDWTRFVDDRNFDYDVYTDDRNFNYNASRDAVADRQWAQQMAYQQSRDAVADQRYQTEWEYRLAQDAMEAAAREAKAASGGSSGRSSGGSGGRSGGSSGGSGSGGWNTAEEMYQAMYDAGVSPEDAWYWISKNSGIGTAGERGSANEGYGRYYSGRAGQDGIDENRQSGSGQLKGSAWDYTQAEVRRLAREGDGRALDAYLDQIVDQLSDKQWEQIKKLAGWN